eukprot:1315679-Amorphochlora_amoeboformis.AAC.1
MASRAHPLLPADFDSSHTGLYGDSGLLTPKYRSDPVVPCIYRCLECLRGFCSVAGDGIAQWVGWGVRKKLGGTQGAAEMHLTLRFCQSDLSKYFSGTICTLRLVPGASDPDIHRLFVYLHGEILPRDCG